MIFIGIICLAVAAISYFRYLSMKNNGNQQDKETSANNAKWQRSLAIIFLVLGIILIIYAIYLRKF